MTDLVDLLHSLTALQYRKVTGREWAGPCPWCGGTDRFHVWPEEGRWQCMGVSAGRAGCDKRGDAIQLLRDLRGLSYREACADLGVLGDALPMAARVGSTSSPTVAQPEPEPAAPSEAWANRAIDLVFDCQAALMERNDNPKARAWLHGRGLSDATLWRAGLGYNPANEEDKYYEPRAAWGLPEERDAKTGRPKDVWLPRGITIPWIVDGDLWGVRIRRPTDRKKDKYHWIVGGGRRALYGADRLQAGAAVVLVEGELDALLICQECAGAVAVATGSTAGARALRWVARLASAARVLVAFDNDENKAGDMAARYWLDVLPNARRWRPWWSDPTDMQRDGASLRAWVAAGLEGVTV